MNTVAINGRIIPFRTSENYVTDVITSMTQIRRNPHTQMPRQAIEKLAMKGPKRNCPLLLRLRVDAGCTLRSTTLRRLSIHPSRKSFIVQPTCDSFINKLMRVPNENSWSAKVFGSEVSIAVEETNQRDESRTASEPCSDAACSSKDLETK